MDQMKVDATKRSKKGGETLNRGRDLRFARGQMKTHSPNVLTNCVGNNFGISMNHNVINYSV